MVSITNSCFKKNNYIVPCSVFKITYFYSSYSGPKKKSPDELTLEFSFDLPFFSFYFRNYILKNYYTYERYFYYDGLSYKYNRDYELLYRLLINLDYVDNKLKTSYSFKKADFNVSGYSELEDIYLKNKEKYYFHIMDHFFNGGNIYVLNTNDFFNEFDGISVDNVSLYFDSLGSYGSLDNFQEKEYKIINSYSDFYAMFNSKFDDFFNFFILFLKRYNTYFFLPEYMGLDFFEKLNNDFYIKKAKYLSGYIDYRYLYRSGYIGYYALNNFGTSPTCDFSLPFPPNSMHFNRNLYKKGICFADLQNNTETR